MVAKVEDAEKKRLSIAKRAARFQEILKSEAGYAHFLIRAGVLPGSPAVVIRDALKATVTKVFCQQGEVVYSRAMVDHTTRLRAAEMALKLYDVFPAERKELSGPGGGPIELENRPIPPEVRELIDELTGRDKK